MIHTIIGLMNSGKTALMTLEGFKDFCRARVIFSNYNLNFPHTLINTDYLLKLAKEMPDLYNITFLLDELWINLDSRKSQGNTLMTYFFNQSSKGDTRIFLTSQDDRQLDIRLRNNQHLLSVCSRRLIINNKQFKLNDTIRILPVELQPFLYFKVKTYTQKLVGFDRRYKKQKTELIRASPIFPLYDTHQKIKNEYYSRTVSIES